MNHYARDDEPSDVFGHLRELAGVVAGFLPALRWDVRANRDETRAVRSVVDNIDRKVDIMADQSALLNSIAQGLRGLGEAVTALRSENVTLRSRNAELEGEDAAESQATADVKSEFDNLAGILTAEPSAPDVDPLPPVDDQPVSSGDPVDGNIDQS